MAPLASVAERRARLFDEPVRAADTVSTVDLWEAGPPRRSANCRERAQGMSTYPPLRQYTLFSRESRSSSTRYRRIVA